MNRTTDLSPQGRLLFGGILMLAGLPLVLVGLGILQPDPKSLHAPLWVAACAGFAFMAAGATVALGAVSKAEHDGSLTAEAPLFLRMLQYGLGLSVVTGLALVGTWVAFGPGERNFKSSISLLGMSQSVAASEMIGRALFGVGAVLAWLFLIAVARQGWRKLFTRTNLNQVEANGGQAQ